MIRKSQLAVSVAAAIAGIGLASAEVEVSGYIKNETAVGIASGQYIGEATSTVDSVARHSDLMKFETSARLFANADIGEESSMHLDLNAIYDTEGVNKEYKGHRSYTQHDWLREAYIDTNVAGWDLRLGKQQVVWGTADGIKLLDLINPTDFREINQNNPEEARIPVWMINAEKDVGEDGNFQFILSQNKPNVIPGLNANGDQGHAFIMKGVDSITGPVHGFLNIVPALAGVASNFSEVARTAGSGAFAGALGFDVTGDGAPDAIATGLTGFAGLTVHGFAGRNQATNAGGSIICSVPAGCAGLATATAGGTLLNNFAQNGANFGLPFSNSNVTNLATATYNSSAADTTFEYMANATFATFNTFAQNVATGVPSTVSQYVKDYPKGENPNTGFRFRSSTDYGLNFGINYAYHYDPNPSVSLSWHDAVTGQQLDTVLATNGLFGAAGYSPDPNGAGAGVVGTTISRDQVPNAITTDANGNATNAVSVLLRNPNDAAGAFYGAINPNGNAGSGVTLSANAANGTMLRFTERLNRIHSLGASFDYAFDTESLGSVVLRGEFVYDKDTLQPVVDKRLLSIGDLEGGLSPEKQDMFKYVLGVDVTVATNMLVSTQFIQFVNLDYREDNRTCTTQLGTNFDCSRYTADAATLHLTNGLQKAEETKEFVSLFLSKPFGAEQQHRWNNILILEDTGGKWNRFDVEYAFDDNLIGSAEWNHYFGDENSTFGQLENSSSIQLGLKYIFD